MRPDKALEIVRRIGAKRGRRWSSRGVRTPAPVPIYAKMPTRRWTWEGASARERAQWVRANRDLGVMDWDLCELFNLTQKGLAAIVRGQDWNESFIDQQETKT